MQSETEPNRPEEDVAKSLELKKLALEIADLERPWWKRPAYVLAALPTMLAFGTLLIGVLSGYFQVSYTKLENQKHDVEIQVKDFEAKRDELHRQYDALAKEKADLESSVTMARSLQAEAQHQAERAHKAEAERDACLRRGRATQSRTGIMIPASYH